MKIKLFCFLMFSATLSYAQVDSTGIDEPEADKSGGGLAIHVGLGDLYGGSAGGTAEYQLIMNSKLRLTPFASIGKVSTFGEETSISETGYCYGANIEFGKVQRFFTGISYGTHFIDHQTDTAQAHYDETVVIKGPSVAIGYKGVSKIGLMWNTFIGMAYEANSPDWLGHSTSTFAPIIGAGIGLKL